MILNLTEVSDEPLHGQISRQIRAKILAGELDDGDALPSIRGLARDVKVSVITVQRAYDDLDREGLIQARRGKGFFVTRMSDASKEKLARQRFRDALEPIVREADAEGLESEQIRNIFRETLNDTKSDTTSESGSPR